MSCNNLPPDNDIEGLDWALGDKFYAQPLPVPAPDPNTPRKIRLVWSVSDYHYPSVDGIRVRIEAPTAALMPHKVFAYRLVQAEDSAEPVGAFDHVCSAADLEEFPEDAPLPDAKPAWFRLNYVDVVLRSRAEVHAFIRDTAMDVYTLKQTLDLIDRLNPVSELWIGGPPPGPSSSSSSSA